MTDGERCMPAAGDDGFEVEAGAGAGAGSGAAAPPVGTGRGLETVETDAGAGEGAGAAMGAAEGAAGSLAGEGAGPGAGSMRFDGLSLKLKAATSGVKSLAWWALAKRTVQRLSRKFDYAHLRPSCPGRIVPCHGAPEPRPPPPLLPPAGSTKRLIPPAGTTGMLADAARDSRPRVKSSSMAIPPEPRERGSCDGAEAPGPSMEMPPLALDFKAVFEGGATPPALGS